MIKVNGVELKQDHFPDGTLLMKNTLTEDDLPACNLCIYWYYENDAELFALICAKRHFDAIYDNIELYMPYIPHARQDRVKSYEDIFTLKYFCEVINSLHFDVVYVRDAHSNVSLALLNNVQEMPIDHFVSKAIKDCGAPVLFFPDEGAMKRYSTMFNMPYAFGMKKRDWATGAIQGLDIINVEAIRDKDVLIIDDICSRGGTFYHSAKALKEAGAKNIYLYVSHLENTVFDGDMYKTGIVEHIYTTPTIFSRSPFNPDDETDKITIIY